MNKDLNLKYVIKLQAEQKNRDTEVAHSNADDLLCELLIELGYHNVAYEYQKVNKWYA